MNILADFFEAINDGALPGTSFAVPSYPANLTDSIAIINYWRTLNQAYLDAQTWINYLTARMNALNAAVSSGGFAAYVALRLKQAGTGYNYHELLVQSSAAINLSSTYSALGAVFLAASTAQFLTPLQTALQNFESTYQTQLKAAGLV